MFLKQPSLVEEYIVVDETALRTRENNGDDMTCVYFKGVQHE